jgi:hypothetical protein
MSVEIEFPIGAFRRRPEPPQIVRRLFQHTNRQTFFRRGRCRLSWRNREMGVASIPRFGIQKRGELLARHSREGLLRHLFAQEIVRKHHELTSELRCLRNTAIFYQVHHIDRWFDWLHPFLKILKPDISKNLKFFRI